MDLTNFDSGDSDTKYFSTRVRPLQGAPPVATGPYMRRCMGYEASTMGACLTIHMTKYGTGGLELDLATETRC